MKRLAVLLSWLCLTWWSMTLAVVGQEIPPRALSEFDKLRLVYVPYEDLSVALNDGIDRILLDRENVLKLLGFKPEVIQPAPREFVWHDADFRIALAGRVAHVTARIRGQSFADQPIAVPLPLANVAVQSIALNGAAPAVFWSTGDRSKRRVLLLMERAGDYELELQLTLPLSADAARQTLRGDFSQVPVSSWTVVSPGNVDLVSGGAVISRQYDTTAEETVLELVPPLGAFELVLTLNNRQRTGELAWDDSIVTVATLDETGNSYTITLLPRVLRGALHRAEWQIDELVEVLDVIGEDVREWGIGTTPEGPTLWVEFQNPIENSTALTVTAISQRPAAAGSFTWESPRWRGLGADHHSQVVAVALPPPWELREVDPRQLFPVNLSAIAQLVTAIGGLTEGGPPIRLAYFAPAADAELRLQLARKPGMLTALESVLFTVGEREIGCLADLDLTNTGTAHFEVEVDLPPGFHLHQVHHAGGPLPFRVVGDHNGRRRVAITLAAPLGQGERTKFRLLSSIVPEEWFSRWMQRTVSFVVPSIVGADETRGVLAIVVGGELNVSGVTAGDLAPLARQDLAGLGLEELAPQLAYEFATAEATVQLDVVRRIPRVTAQSVTFYRLEPAHQVVHAELLIDVRQASCQKFALRLPSTANDMVQVTTGNGRPVAELTRRHSEEENIWDVQLESRAAGPFSLHIDYESAMPDVETFITQLTPVMLVDTALQTAMVVVEGSPQLDIAVAGSIPTEPLESLPAVHYAPGKFLVGLYPVADGESLTISATKRQTSPAPPVVVTKRELRSEISRNGVCQTWALFRIKTTHPQVIVRLPATATLWSVLLDKNPQRMQRVGDDLLIMFPRGSSNVETHLEVSYEDSVATLGWRTDVTLLPPQLFLTDGQSHPTEEVPCLKSTWQIHAPSGYVIAEPRDGWQPVTAEHRLSWAQRHLHWFDLTSLGYFIDPVKSAMPGSFQFEAAEGIDVRDGARYDLPNMGAAGEGHVNESDRRVGDAPDAAGGQRSVQSGGDVAQPRESAGQKPAAWGYSGFRGIDIRIDEDDRAARFESLGNRPRIGLRIVRQGGVHLSAWALALAAVAVGLALWRSSAGVKFLWIVMLVAIALAGLWLTPWIANFDSMVEPLVWVALLMALLYLGAGFTRIVARWARSFFAKKSRASAFVTYFLFAALCATALGQNGDSGSTDNPPPTLPPRIIDDRAIVVPFELSSWPHVDSPRWLFPRQWYERLLAQSAAVEPTNPMTNRQFVWARAKYEATSDGRTLSVVGWLDLSLPGDTAVDIPLSVVGGTILSAELDGRPAILIADAVADSAGNAEANPATVEVPIVVRVTGAGWHQVQLRLEFPLEKIGGGFRVAGRLPPSLASELRFIAANQPLTVRWRSATVDHEVALDAGVGASFAANEDGSFALDWRETIAPSGITGSANWKSDTIVEVLTNEIRGRATVHVQFGEALGVWYLSLPPHVRIEQIVGDNLQGWTPLRDDASQVELKLLATAHSAQIAVTYSLPIAALNDHMSRADIPLCSVVGHGTASGRIRIARSPLVELQVADSAAVRRIDWDGVGFAPWNDARRQPLGVVPFQSFDFARGGARIAVDARLTPSEFNANHETLMRVGLTHSVMESRFQLSPTRGGIREWDVIVPSDLPIRETTWQVTRENRRQNIPFDVVSFAGDSQTIWRFRLADQVTERISVAVQITQPLRDLHALVWRGWRVPQAKNEKFQYAAVADSALQLGMHVTDAMSIPAGELGNWFDRSLLEARPLAARAEGVDHRVEIRWTRLPPRVKFESVSDVSWTRQAIEETLLLEWTIEQSGIEKVEFLLPARWSDAEVSGPLISRVEKTPTADGWLQVVVNLQDRVLGPYRLAIQRDAPLSDQWSPALPVNLTGETAQRFITVQNMGRDELVFEPLAGVEQVVRERPLFRALQNKLQAPYLATAYVSASNDRAAGLTIRTVPRDTVQTVAASIPLSETDVVLDAGGGYVAKQTLRVTNRTEPVLELVLPGGARLISLQVDGAPIMPLAAAGNARLVRIPLVKTSELDLDYAIVAVYSGQLDFAQSDWVMPLAFTQNIETQVSHVRLHVSPEVRPLWFGGTMTRMESGDVLTDEYLDYRAKQVAEISGKLRTQSGAIAFGTENRRQRMEELSEELNRQAGQSMNRQLQQKSSELQRELSELDLEVSAQGHNKDQMGNAIRKNINELVADQNVLNESRAFSGQRDAQQRAPAGDQAEQRGLVSGQDFPGVNFQELAQTYQLGDDMTERPSATRGEFQISGAGRVWQEPSASASRPQSRAREMGGEAPTDSPSLNEPARAPGQSSAGVMIDVVPQGETYYFRVPRGRPELTMRVVSEKTKVRLYSTAQLAGVLLVVLVIGVMLMRRGPQAPRVS